MGVGVRVETEEIGEKVESVPDFLGVIHLMYPKPWNVTSYFDVLLVVINFHRVAVSVKN